MSTPYVGSGRLLEDSGGQSPPGGEVAGQVQEQAQRVADQAQTRVREEVERRASDLGARAGSTAEDLRDVAEHLRSQGKDGPARLAEQAAQRVSRASAYLQGSDGDRLLHDVEELGRRRPWVAVAGGAALGLAASRFLKASSTQRYRRSSVASGPRRAVTPVRSPGAPASATPAGGRFQAPSGSALEE